MIFLRPLLPLLALLQFGVIVRGAAPTITLAGSSTATRVLMVHKSGVEDSHGVEIHLLPTGSGRGLVELDAGRADAAMLSGPVDYLLAKVNATTPTSLRVEQLEQLKLAATPKADVVALLHPSNSLRHLTLDEFRRILIGEITNWSALGGPDRPIVLILPDELDGVRATVATAVLKGRSFSDAARIVEKTGDIPSLVAGMPGAISVLARVTLSRDAKWAEVEPVLNVPLYIVARRDRLETDTKLEMVLNSLHSRAR